MLQMLILPSGLKTAPGKCRPLNILQRSDFVESKVVCAPWVPKIRLPACLLAWSLRKDQEAEVLLVYGGLELVYLCRTPKKLIPASGHEYSMCVTPERKFVPAPSNSVNDALRRLRQAAASYKNTPSIFLHTSPEEEHELQQVLHLSYVPSGWSFVPSEWSCHTRKIAIIFCLCNDW